MRLGGEKRWADCHPAGTLIPVHPGGPACGGTGWGASATADGGRHIPQHTDPRPAGGGEDHAFAGSGAGAVRWGRRTAPAGGGGGRARGDRRSVAGGASALHRAAHRCDRRLFQGGGVVHPDPGDEPPGGGCG